MVLFARCYVCVFFSSFSSIIIISYSFSSRLFRRDTGFFPVLNLCIYLNTKNGRVCVLNRWLLLVCFKCNIAARLLTNVGKFNWIWKKNTHTHKHNQTPEHKNPCWRCLDSILSLIVIGFFFIIWFDVEHGFFLIALSTRPHIPCVLYYIND